MQHDFKFYKYMYVVEITLLCLFCFVGHADQFNLRHSKIKQAIQSQLWQHNHRHRTPIWRIQFLLYTLPEVCFCLLYSQDLQT